MKVLGMIGLMESVKICAQFFTAYLFLFLLFCVTAKSQALEEAHKAVEETIEHLLAERDAEFAAGSHTVAVEEWIAAWHQQIELLDVLSVPGMSTLIQWASAVENAAENTSTSSRS